MLYLIHLKVSASLVITSLFLVLLLSVGFFVAVERRALLDNSVANSLNSNDDSVEIWQTYVNTKFNYSISFPATFNLLTSGVSPARNDQALIDIQDRESGPDLKRGYIVAIRKTPEEGVYDPRSYTPFTKNIDTILEGKINEKITYPRGETVRLPDILVNSQSIQVYTLMDGDNELRNYIWNTPSTIYIVALDASWNDHQEILASFTLN